MEKKLFIEDLEEITEHDEEAVNMLKRRAMVAIGVILVGCLARGGTSSADAAVTSHPIHTTTASRQSIPAVVLRLVPSAGSLTVVTARLAGVSLPV